LVLKPEALLMLKLEDFLMLRELHNQGMSISEIAKEARYKQEDGTQICELEGSSSCQTEISQSK
jgi:hypothetical protein